MKILRKMSMWLRGGIFVGGVALISVLLFMGCYAVFVFPDSDPGGGVFCTLLSLATPVGFLILVHEHLPFINQLSGYGMLTAIVLFWFIVGSVAGGFMGYMQKRYRNKKLWSK